MMERVLLELATLPSRYPDVGEDLLNTYGPRVIYRLAHDPTRQAESAFSREVHIDWVARPGNAPPQPILRVAGWEGLIDIARRCPQVALTTNQQTITEQAAIGVMALLVNDLEGATALEVLPIGSGPDYRLWSITSETFTIEVSGIREVDSAADSRQRLTDKRGQLLGKMESGFVSVTTFSHPTGPIVHSYLHFVSRSDGRPGKKGNGRRDRKMASVLDVSGAATRASLQGEAALGEGDTALARKKHSEAGDLLKRKVAAFPDAPRKAVARFLAATQYFRAGEYLKAAKLSEKINQDKLPEDSRNRFSEFKREVEHRTAPGYVAGTRQELARNWKSGKRELVLKRLQDDPYLLPPDALAFVRAIIA